MLFIQPTEAELTSYNKIRYKDNFAITNSVTSMNLTKTFREEVFGKDVSLFNHSESITYDLKIISSDFEITNSSTWENSDEDFNYPDINIKLLVNKTFKIKSKIVKVNHFRPRVFVD